jgi:EAL domain-containing protein (putative c-di-GMP-specific phosphodiesterase class I)
VEHRLRPVLALRNALAESRFVLHYQPQIDLDTGEVVSIEALLRWLDGDGRAANPGPLLEEANRMGLATSVGQWILRQAAEDANARSESGAGRIPIAVNVSALQLNDPRFATIVERTLREAGLPTRLLEIEIAEHEAAEIQPRAIEALREVRRLGVRVALDDFGAATSLRALEALPLDAVKIDPAYVARLPDSPHVESLVRGMIALARGLGYEVVAEGVETGAQLNALRALGCRRAQGYLLAQPMPAGKLALHLREDEGPWNEILSQSAGGVFTF